jgi:hypothetical protein
MSASRYITPAQQAISQKPASCGCIMVALHKETGDLSEGPTFFRVGFGARYSACRSKYPHPTGLD